VGDVAAAMGKDSRAMARHSPTPTLQPVNPASDWEGDEWEWAKLYEKAWRGEDDEETDEDEANEDDWVWQSGR